MDLLPTEIMISLNMGIDFSTCSSAMRQFLSCLHGQCDRIRMQSSLVVSSRADKLQAKYKCSLS